MNAYTVGILSLFSEIFNPRLSVIMFLCSYYVLSVAFRSEYKSQFSY
jgi:hypothetical protein